MLSSQPQIGHLRSNKSSICHFGTLTSRIGNIFIFTRYFAPLANWDINEYSVRAAQICSRALLILRCSDDLLEFFKRCEHCYYGFNRFVIFLVCISPIYRAIGSGVCGLTTPRRPSGLCLHRRSLAVPASSCGIVKAECSSAAPASPLDDSPRCPPPANVAGLVTLDRTVTWV